MVTVVRGQIYAIKVNTSTEQSTISRYNVELCSWVTVLSSEQGCREESCIVTAGNHLYVFGGKPPQASGYVAKAERFDTVGKKWDEIEDMQQERGCAFGVANEGKIFVAGGRNKEKMVSQTCEMYNVSTNEWQFIGSLNDVREYGACMVCLNGTLYVLGGTKKAGKESVLSVECYDATKDKWIQKTTIPVENISKGNKDSFTGCVLKLSKGVLNKLNPFQKVFLPSAFAPFLFGGPAFTSSSFAFGRATNT